MVIDVATHTETKEELVIYSNINDLNEGKPSKIWARPRRMFESYVKISNNKIPRFKLSFPESEM